MKKSSCKLIFLSEPQTYQCDLAPLLHPFLGSYEAYLNSEDVFDMDLPLTHPKAKGGTMVMWHISLSPHLKVLPSTSPCFISILLSPPGILPSLHTAVYLPTAQQDVTASGWMPLRSWSSMSRVLLTSMDPLVSFSVGILMQAVRTKEDQPCS